MITEEQVISSTHEQLQEWLDIGQLSVDQTFSGFERLSMLHIFANNKETKDLKEKIKIIAERVKTDEKTKIPDTVDYLGMTPLENAILRGNGEAARALIYNGANVDHVISNDADGNFNKVTPILLLLKYRETFLLENDFPEKRQEYIQLVAMLINHGADLSARDSFGTSALHLACENGYTEAVELIVDEMKHPIDLPDNSRMTPLHYATEKGHADIVDFLLGKSDLILMPSFDVNSPPETLPTKHRHAYIFTNDTKRIFYIQDTRKPASFSGIPLIDKKTKNNRYENLLERFKILKIESTIVVKTLSLEDEQYIVGKPIIERKRANPELLSMDNTSALHFSLSFSSSFSGLFFSRDHETQYRLAKSLIEAGAYPNQMDKRGDTPLHLAAKSGNILLIRLLLEELRKLNIKRSVKNNAGMTPFYYSIRSFNDIEAIKLLAELEEADEPDNFNTWPAHLAAASGRLDLVKYFIEEKKFDIEIKDNRGYDIFHAALASKQLNVIEYFIETIAVSPLPDKKGRNPIFHVIRHGDIDLTEQLLGRCGDLTILDEQGRNILFPLVEVWCTNDGSKSKKFQAIFETISNRYDFDLNTRDKNGLNLIFAAVMAKHEYEDTTEYDEFIRPGNRPYVISYLMNQGVNTWVSDKLGFTPYAKVQYLLGRYGELKSEARNECFAIKDLLSEKIPKKINQVYKINCFSMYFLFSDYYREEYPENVRLEILIELIEIGADPNVTLNERGETAVFFAIRNGELNVLRSLYLHGANLNLVDKFGKTPFFNFALCHFSRQIIDDFLIGLYQEFPLHIAAKNGDTDTIRKLITYGADPNSEDHSYKRPIDYIEEEKSEVLTELLKLGSSNSIDLNSRQLKQIVCSQSSPVLWIADLTVTYHSKKSNKKVTVPADDMHKELRSFENMFRRRIENDRHREKSKDGELHYNRTQGVPIPFKNQPNFAVAALTFIVSDSKRETPHGTHGRCITKTIPIHVTFSTGQAQKNIYHVKNIFGWYDFCLMSELNPNESPKAGKMYLEKQDNNNKLRYVVIDPEGKKVNGLLDFSIDGDLTKEVLQNQRTQILEAISKTGANFVSNNTIEKFRDSCREYAESARKLYLSEFGIEIKLDKEANYTDNQKIFHSEQALHEYLEKNISFIINKKLLGTVLKNNSVVSQGYKVYAMVLDIYSTREMCGNCVDRTIAMQSNSAEGKFMHNLNIALLNAGLLRPKNGVRMITRVSSDLQSKGTPHVSSPDDEGSNTSVFISEKNEHQHASYTPLYKQFRNTIGIKETKNALVLASPQKHTAHIFSKKHIKPMHEGQYTIFTTQEADQIEEEIYETIFKMGGK